MIVCCSIYTHTSEQICDTRRNINAARFWIIALACPKHVARDYRRAC